MSPTSSRSPIRTVDAVGPRRHATNVGGERDVAPVETFVDDRGNGLRVSWREDHRVVVVSIWRDGQCVASVRLAGDDLMRLSTAVTQAWLDSQHPTAPE